MTPLLVYHSPTTMPELNNMIPHPRLKCAAILIITLIMMLGGISQAQSEQDTPAASMTFLDTTYHLAWRSDPAADYTKYEYLPAGEALPQYHRMLLVERLTNGMTVADVVNHQVAFLSERKQNDPVANHRLIQNESTGEFLLDFVLSGTDEDGDTIIEWNAYRYLPYQRDDGAQGVQLYGYSARAYGDEDGREFLIGLQDTRAQIIQALVSASVP